MRHRGPIAPSKAIIPMLIPEHQEFLNGLRPRNARFAGWTWKDDDDDDADKDKDADAGGDGGSDSDKDSGKDADSGSDTISREEFDRVKRRMEAADKRASEAERKVREAEDAKKGDLEKATDRVTELETTIEEKDKEISGLRLQNAFLVSNKHEWHDSEVALALAETKGYLEDVTGDDGTVDKKALKKALDRLAKENPYLVQSKKKSDDDKSDGPSGEPAGRRSANNKDEKARKQELKDRFPVLNR